MNIITLRTRLVSAGAVLFLAGGITAAPTPPAASGTSPTDRFEDVPGGYSVSLQDAFTRKGGSVGAQSWHSVNKIRGSDLSPAAPFVPLASGANFAGAFANSFLYYTPVGITLWIGGVASVAEEAFQNFSLTPPVGIGARREAPAGPINLEQVFGSDGPHPRFSIGQSF